MTATSEMMDSFDRLLKRRMLEHAARDVESRKGIPSATERRRKKEAERHRRYEREHREERAAYIKEWRKNNPEKVRAYIRKWRTENPEKAQRISREAVRRYRLLHPEKNAETNRRWRKNNPEKCKEIQDRYYLKHKPEILAKRKLRYREELKRKEAERAKSGQ